MAKFGQILTNKDIEKFCEGRLTLTTGVPITTADVTAATTIYFTPYKGNAVSIYNGTYWQLYNSAELSLALGTLTSGKNYDVFIYDNAGTLTLELSAAWTNDTTRADALALQDGVYCKSGALTRRWLGTIRTTSTTTTEDSETKRFVMSYYNRVRKKLFLCPGYSNNNAGTLYTINSTVWYVNPAATSPHVGFIHNGESNVEFTVRGLGSTEAVYAALGLAIDSTTDSLVEAFITSSNYYFASARYVYNSNSAGYHYANFMCRTGSAANRSLFADNARNGAVADPFESYIDGSVEV